MDTRHLQLKLRRLQQVREEILEEGEQVPEELDEAIREVSAGLAYAHASHGAVELQHGERG